MTRFALYSSPPQNKPKGPWPPLRIFAWTLLWAAMFFWAWVFFAGR